jgi:hypothetical protein
VAAVASFLSAVLTEIDLCDACSCQEILRRNGRGQPMAARGCQPLKPQLSVWGSTGQPYAPDMPRTREARLPPQIGAITTNPRRAAWAAAASAEPGRTAACGAAFTPAGSELDWLHSARTISWGRARAGLAPVRSRTVGGTYSMSRKNQGYQYRRWPVIWRSNNRKTLGGLPGLSERLSGALSMQ